MSKFHVESVSSRESLHQLADEWNSLLARSRANSIFLRFEWIATWLEKNICELAVLLVRDQQNRLVGVAPFYRSRLQFRVPLRYRCLRPLGDSESGAEYQMPFFASETETGALAALTDYLSSTRVEWDLIYMGNLAAWTEAGSQLVKAFKDSPLPCESRPNSFSQIALPTSTDEFWQQQSRTQRYAVNRARRKLADQTVEITRCASQAELPLYTDALLALHEIRWRSVGEAGAFERRPAFRAFLLDFLPVALDSGWLRLHILKVDNKARAVQLGFVYNGTYSVIQEGFDVGFQPGIGNLLRASVIEECIAEGIRVYDFLGGLSEHKRRWGAVEKAGADLIVWNANPRNLIFKLGPFWPSGRFFREL
ncbi:MAG: GNAT family N-acetyltransferase [Pseudomonadota bacterium]